MASIRRVRLREIATRANCAVGTVSMALNDSPELPEVTRKRIQAIAQELGYVANRLAKSLSLGRTGVLGVVMPFSIDPYYAAVLDSLNTEAETRGYQLQIQFHRWSMDAEEKAVRRLAESQTDGILLYPARNSYAGSGLYQWLASTKIPLISLSKRGTDLPSLAGRIVKNYAMEGVLAGNELLRLGHRRIDILPFQTKGSLELTQYQSLLALPETNPGAEIKVFTRDYFLSHETVGFFGLHGLSSSDYESLTDRLIEEYLAWPARGSAVITSNNQVAWKLMAALRREGLRCPGDISLISSGILGNGAGGGIPLSATEYDPARIACLALDSLIRRIQTGEATGEMSVEPRLCLRETTAPLGFQSANGLVPNMAAPEKNPQIQSV